VLRSPGDLGPRPAGFAATHRVGPLSQRNIFRMTRTPHNLNLDTAQGPLPSTFRGEIRDRLRSRRLMAARESGTYGRVNPDGVTPSSDVTHSREGHR